MEENENQLSNNVLGINSHLLKANNNLSITPRSESNATQSSSDGLDLPKSEWINFVMKQHPEVLELKEKSRFLFKQETYGRLNNASKTESKESVPEYFVMQLIYKFLEERGLVKTIDQLKEEISPFEKEKLTSIIDTPENTLLFMLCASIKDTANLWLNLPPDPFEENFEDPEVEILEDYFQLDSEDSVFWADINDDTSIVKNSQDGSIQAATLNRLILETVMNSTDYKFQKLFFVTHRCFVSSEKLLLLFIKSYEKGFHTPLVDNIPPLILKWLERHPLDFSDKLISLLNRFIDLVILKQPLRENTLELANKMRSALTKIKKAPQKVKENDHRKPDPILPKNIFSPKLELDSIDEEEIARQLCLLDYSIYKKIQPNELFEKSWLKLSKSHAPHILDLIERSNNLAKWVANKILSKDKMKEQIIELEKLLKISEHLFSLFNFNSLHSFYIGLYCNSVENIIKKLYPSLSGTHQNILLNLELLFNNELNYKNYRETINRVYTSCIPFIGVALKDLIFLEDCEPTILDNKINWTKMKAMGETILDVLRYQSVPYNLHYVHQIAQFFIDFSNLPTDQQFIERVLILELSERANSIV